MFLINFKASERTQETLGVTPSLVDGQCYVVSVLTFYSDDPSSNLVEVCNFYCVQITRIKTKKCQLKSLYILGKGQLTNKHDRLEPWYKGSSTATNEDVKYYNNCTFPSLTYGSRPT